MSQLQERIAQFRKMASDDPENELGHFRLGQLLAEAGQHDDAVQSFRRTLELSPQFSKVYQLLGNSLIHLNRRDEAAETLRQGFQVADERGDNPGERAIRSSISLMRMLKHTRNGPEKSCLPKPSGSSPRAAVSMERSSFGATTLRRSASSWPIRGKANFPGRTSGATASKAPLP